MNTKDRLLEFLKYLGTGQTAFENNVGWSRGHISKIKGAIGSDMLAKLTENFPELSIEWLITGKGDMLKSQINVGNIKNGRGNVATHGGQVISIPNFGGEKIIKGNGEVELQNSAQSLKNFETEKSILQQRIADLENMLDMKDEIIAMLKEKINLLKP